MLSFAPIATRFQARSSKFLPMIWQVVKTMGFFLCASLAHATALTPIEEGFPTSVVSPSQVAKSSSPHPSIPFEKSEAMSWKTEYVGRVQMNFPTNRTRNWSNEFDMAVVKRLPEMTPEVFWKGVDIVRQRYENQKHSEVPTRLAHFEKLGSHAAFVMWYDNDATVWGPNMDRYLHLATVHAYSFYTRTLPIRDVKPSPSLFKPFVAQYTPIFSRIHPLKEGQAPNRDGLAIDGAVVSGDTGRNAKAGLRVEIATGTLLSIAYIENNYQVALRSSFEELAVDETLAKKMSVYDEPRAVLEFKVLRRQERTLAGIAGQEFIAKTTLKNGHSYYRFNWQVKGANDGGLLEPTIAINLNTPKYPTAHAGNPPFAELPPEPELIKLWEFALASFKWRNGALPDGQQIKAVN